MRAAADDPHRVGACGRDAESAARRHCRPRAARRRRPRSRYRSCSDRHVDHAEHRPMVVDQRDVDRELAVAIDEFLGAVQRIDQPVAVPAGCVPRSPADRTSSEMIGISGVSACQAGDDAVMRGEIGLRQRRLVVFALHVEIGRVDFEDRAAGILGERDDGFDQVICKSMPYSCQAYRARSIAMNIDPQTALQRAETLMLDMDGTLLDLAFDNYIWRNWCRVDIAAAKRHELRGGARPLVRPVPRPCRAISNWYCLDHWCDDSASTSCSCTTMSTHRIGYLPGALDFLRSVQQRTCACLLVTNSHPRYAGVEGRGDRPWRLFRRHVQLAQLRPRKREPVVLARAAGRRRI